MAVRHLLGDALEQRVALADRALGWLDALPDGGPDRTRAALLGAVAAANLVDDRIDDAIATAKRALELVPDDLDVRITLGATMVFAGDEEGWTLLEAVLREATSSGREAEAARAHRMLATSAAELVEYRRAKVWLDEVSSSRRIPSAGTITTTCGPIVPSCAGRPARRRPSGTRSARWRTGAASPRRSTPISCSATCGSPAAGSTPPARS